MKTVWKFPLNMRGGWTVVPAEADAKVALVGIDPASGAVAVWVEVKEWEASPPRLGAEAVAELTALPERLMRIVGTGHEIGDGEAHVGSVTDHRAGLVWHVYERLPAAAEQS